MADTEEKPAAVVAAEESAASGSGGDATEATSADASTKEAPKKPSFPFVPHTEMPAMTEPVKVVYCPIDGMPPDYCDYGGKFDQCKPWLLTNYPQYYPELAGLSLEDKDSLQKEAKDKKTEDDEKKKVKDLPGGKKKRSTSPKVTISVAKRQGRKMTTTIVGLDTFDVKLEDAAKIFKKKFACGSSATKGNPGQPDAVEIQGEPGEAELIALIVKSFPEVPKKKITYSESTK